VIRKLERFPSDLKILVFEVTFLFRSKTTFGKKFVEQILNARSHFVRRASLPAAVFPLPFWNFAMFLSLYFFSKIERIPDFLPDAANVSQ
jgi:hypothetical protein